MIGASAGRPSFSRLPLAGAVLLASGSSAMAEELTFVAVDRGDQSARIELIDSSRLGCSAITQLAPGTGQSGQCAFDVATKGARVTALQDFKSGTFEAYATIARTSTGAFTPDQLLLAPERRSNQSTEFFLAGFKGSAFDQRLKVTAEFARSEQVVDYLRDQDPAQADWTEQSGSSALVRIEAILARQPGFKWTLNGEYRTASKAFSVGTSNELRRHFAMPGTRFALTSKARLGELGLSAGLDQQRTPFDSSSTRKAAFDFAGIGLTLRSRASEVNPVDGSSLLDSSTRSESVYLDLDSHLIADRFLPNVGRLPLFVPAMINVSLRSSETHNRYESGDHRYRRSSLGVDASWETPIGETSLGYWRDFRRGLTEDTADRLSETFQASHAVRRGNWRFGLDAALSTHSGEGTNGFRDKALSFGQSVAYSAPGGPEFRLLLGQDRASIRQIDESYVSTDSYSSVTASLDLSAYLQERFERPDLRLTLDYRKALESSEAEMHLYDELVERWTDDYRREGVLLSFGMKL